MSIEQPRHILLVEDDFLILNAERKSLEQWGYVVSVAQTGEAALSLLAKSNGIDLILMDMNLGDGIDGIQTARLILERVELPVVFLSSHSEEEVVGKAEAIASYGYVVKQSGIAVLDASIKMALRLFKAKRKESELAKAQAASEKELEVLFDTMAEGIALNECIYDERGEMYDYRILKVNRAFYSVADYNPGQVVGNVASRLYGMDANVVRAFWRSHRLKSHVNRVEMRSPRSGKCFAVSTSPIVQDRFVTSFVDITESKNAEDALRESEARLSDIIFSAADWVWEVDEKGRYVFSSQKGSELLGYPHSEIIGKSPFDFMAPQEAGRVSALFSALFAAKAPIRDLENWNLKKNGERVCILTNGVPILDAEGRLLGYRGIDKDITDRKGSEERIQRLLEEKELLLKEVHHRVKNNMNTMKSLVFLQKRLLKDPVAIAAFDDTLGRMDSMGILYEQLYVSTDYNRTSMRAYLSALTDRIIATFPDSEAVIIDKDIDDFELDTRISQTLGIILNELLTNIMKYAFAGRKGGRIAIQGRLEGGHVTFSVQDDGNGMPDSVDFESSPGFGLLLVKELTRQLDGAIRIQRGEGTRVILEFAR